MEIDKVQDEDIIEFQTNLNDFKQNLMHKNLHLRKPNVRGKFRCKKCENCVNPPGLDEDRGEHEVGAEDGVELEEDAGVLVERAVEEQNPGDLAHQGAPEQKG